MLESIMAKMEKKFMHALEDRLSVETHIDEESVSLTTVTHWDGIEVSSVTVDLTPLIDIIREKL